MPMAPEASPSAASSLRRSDSLRCRRSTFPAREVGRRAEGAKEVDRLVGLRPAPLSFRIQNEMVTKLWAAARNGPAHFPLLLLVGP